MNNALDSQVISIVADIAKGKVTSGSDRVTRLGLTALLAGEADAVSAFFRKEYPDWGKVKGTFSTGKNLAKWLMDGNHLYVPKARFPWVIAGVERVAGSTINAADIDALAEPIEGDTPILTIAKAWRATKRN